MAANLGNYFNPIVLTDDEDDDHHPPIDHREYEELHWIMRRILRRHYARDDEVIIEMDHARGTTREDIYDACMRVESEPEEDLDTIPTRQSKIKRKFVDYYETDEEDEVSDEDFVPQQYKEDKDKDGSVVP
ncbi:uncharacterized protein LOC130591922 [Beta vulgaris subsp. vulgaris]|uniref:uncharacterized protein LOC130591514 n=1 Tax=Beta vulgaris subsp. vulgaris TaxID=3555 RepID=UPI002547E356|nr:uncharacterized protein LOC130591514 [Beta vulgaris subsp. vulgaris]XP_057251895.1 uncharacterized protein LOC130591922 [Beta vulgaris subsp. vulgaris]